MERSLATSLPLSLLTAVAVAVAGCEGERASSTTLGDTWTPPGPQLNVPGAPAVNGVSPSFASPAMTVRIAGSGFGASLSGVTVSFGGVAAEPLSVSENEILVHPVAGGVIAADGSTEVVVSIGGLSSNATTIRLGVSGDVERIETAAPETVGEIVALADGSLVVTDPIGGRLYRISADGVVRAVADPFARLQSPGAAVTSPDGAVLVFDVAAAAIWHYEPQTGELTAWAEQTPGWTDGAWLGNRMYAVTGNASSIDRLETSGVMSATMSLTACNGATSITTHSGYLYVAAGSRLCTVEGTTGYESEITLSGETTWALESIHVADDALLATGLFTQGPALARIELDGATTIVATPAGYPKAVAQSPMGAVVVGFADGNVMTGNRLLATRVRDLGDFREADGRYLVTGGSAVPFLAEMWNDGAYRVLATGDAPAMWTHVEPDGDGFVLAAYDRGQVVRVAADGTLSVIIEHAAFGPVASFARSTDGGFLLTSYGPDIARYTSNGTLVESAYVHSEGAASFGLVVVDQTVYAAAGDRLLEADIVEGGAAVSRTSSVNGLLGIAADAQGRIYVSDGNDTGDVFRLEGSELVKVGHAGVAMSLSFGADGAILVADLADLPYRMLP